MTVRKTTLSLPVAHPGATPAGLVRRAIGALLARQAERRSLDALARLDDHLLSDIGLCREDRLG